MSDKCIQCFSSSARPSPNDEFLLVSLLIALNSSTNCDRCEGTEWRALSVSLEGAAVQHCYQTKISRYMSELRVNGDTTGRPRLIKPSPCNYVKP